MKIALTSLGCPRNLVDSEKIITLLRAQGHAVTAEPESSDVVVINTCSFVKAARDESIEAILEAGRLKKEGKTRYVVVCGCLPQMFGASLLKAADEIDAVVGTGDIARVPAIVGRLESAHRVAAVSKSVTYLDDDPGARTRLTPRHYAYVKIAEGCDNRCSYCVISSLRGRLRSRPLGSIVSEAEGLVRAGSVKEIVLIGQDTTQYGKDIYGRVMTARLLREIARKARPQWLRLMYAHPAHVSGALIAAVAELPRVVKYLDIPIQHASDRILRKMGRRTTRREMATLFRSIRRRIPGVALRTSVIVGFPGETARDFKELTAFIEEVAFERLGAFAYSREDGTPAAKMAPQVGEEEKAARLDAVMRLQQKISRARNESLIGRRIKVLLDEKAENEENIYIGRTAADAPEIDCSVTVRGRGLAVGCFMDVRVTGAYEYDLIGEKA